MLTEIFTQLDALASALESGGPLGPDRPSLTEARALFTALEQQETRHVRQALRDEAFPFGEAQGELAALRQTFAALCRELVRHPAEALDPRQRRELLDMAYLIRCAPLTDGEDLAALRKARASSRLAAATAS